MKCQEIMKKDVECLSPSATVIDAARRMQKANVGFLPVCDDDNRVLGTITDRDIAIRYVATNRSSSTPVSDIMSKEVVACGPQDDLQTATALMGKYQKSRLLCVDDEGCLLGVISLSDIAQKGERADETLRQVTTREAHAH